VLPNLRLLGPKYGRDLGMIRGLLREGEFAVRDGHVDVGDWTLEPGEFELRTRAREGFAVVDGDGFAVALDTEITPELRVEGVARDVIRQVQELRKQAGLAVVDRIDLTYPGADSDVAGAFARHGERIASEVLAVSCTAGQDWAVARRN
jgi:isoleucyl-tRNA synthetase